MTIRRTLLISYLMISLASALLITLMIFVHLHEILLKEIEDRLNSQAVTIMQQIDTNLFERMENMAIWSELDVMQEIRTRDVDKRLAHFLSELVTNYEGVYQEIFVVNQNGETIAADKAQMIGKPYLLLKPWKNVYDKTHVHMLQPLDADHQALSFSIAIPDAMGTGKTSYLYANFNWDEIEQIFKHHVSEDSYALLVDDNDRILLACDHSGHQPLKFTNLKDALQFKDNVSGKFFDEEVVIGNARSEGYFTFKGFGWRVLILQPSKIAFASVRSLWLTILVFLCLTLFLGILVSFWMSAKISRPIVRLAEFTRDFMEGKRVPLESKPEPINQDSNEISELVSQFSMMISTLEQSRQDMVRVAKLAVIGEMAASMAHEVRTPLGILRSSAQMLQRETFLSEHGQEMVDFILSETKRLNELVTMLLECARPRQPQLRKQDFHHILGHTLELLQSQLNNQNIQLNFRIENEDALLYCDRDQLIQVFLNLIMNAMQHVPRNGIIEIATFIHDGYLEVQINDNGPGIPDENKEKVFDPFFTQRLDGVGLGLTVVQQIVLAHYGKIFVTDSDYGGACFHVLLPINPQQEK